MPTEHLCDFNVDSSTGVTKTKKTNIETGYLPIRTILPNQNLKKIHAGDLGEVGISFKFCESELRDFGDPGDQKSPIAYFGWTLIHLHIENYTLLPYYRYYCYHRFLLCPHP